MRRKYILDAGFLSAFFAGVLESKRYMDEVYEKVSEAYISEINLAEFLYNYARVFGWESTLVRNKLIRNSPIIVVSPDEKQTIEAARIKLKYYDRLSLADSYLVALAIMLKGIIVTTDARIENVIEVPVEVIRIP
ncbi:MAG: type II toxin-antitoxin system VapC family toxin [Candidatus Methanomethylicia archaeon]